MSQWKILKQKPCLSPNIGIPIPSMTKVGVEFWYDWRRNRYWIPFSVCGIGTLVIFFWFHPILHPSNQHSDQLTSTWSFASKSHAHPEQVASSVVFSISSCTLSSHSNSSSLLIVTSTSSMMTTPLVVWERKKKRKKEDALTRMTSARVDDSLQGFKDQASVSLLLYYWIVVSIDRFNQLTSHSCPLAFSFLLLSFTSTNR